MICYFENSKENSVFGEDIFTGKASRMKESAFGGCYKFESKSLTPLTQGGGSRYQINIDDENGGTAQFDMENINGKMSVVPNTLNSTIPSYKIKSIIDEISSTYDHHMK